MSMLERISAQLITIEQRLKEMLDGPDSQGLEMYVNGASPRAEKDPPFPAEFSVVGNNPQINPEDDLSSKGNAPRPLDKQARQPLKANIETLRQSIQRLGILSEITNEVKGQYFLQDVVDVTLDAVSRRSTLSFAVLILGEGELGPYHYYGMRGEPAPWRYLLNECPFPLSGSLAQALIRRRMPDEPDYLLFNDLAAESPGPEEFPWLPADGSLIFVPLRFANQSIGVLMLGSAEADDFGNEMLCKDLYDIGSIAAEAIRTAQMHLEATNNAEKLVNAQLLTREISLAQNYHELVSILTGRISEITTQVMVNLYLEPRLHHLGTSSYMPFALANMEAKLELVNTDSASEDKTALSPGEAHLLEWAVDAGQPLFYEPDLLQSQTQHPFYNETGSAVIVPIADGQQTYGVLHLAVQEGRRKFDECDMIVLRTLTNCAAAAFAKFQLASEKQNSLLSALHPLVKTVESRFGSLSGHSDRTAHNAALLAKTIGLDDDTVMQIRVATMFHDIGMASLSNEALTMSNPALSSAKRETFPRTTRSVLEATNEILTNAGLDSHITDLFGELISYWQQEEIDVLFGLQNEEHTMHAAHPENEIPTIVLKIMDEETQELDSVRKSRLHQNHGHNNHRHYLSNSGGNRLVGPSSANQGSRNRPSSTNPSITNPLSTTPLSDNDVPKSQKKAPHKAPHKAQGKKSLNQPKESPPQATTTLAVQIITLAHALDEFLINVPLGRTGDLALAESFLQQNSYDLFDEELPQTFYTLVAQELALLP